MNEPMNAKQSKVEIEDFGWYVMRTPLFPAVYTEQIKNCQSPQDFKKLFDNALFKEAIYLASPGLYAQFDKWLKGSIKFRKNPEKEERKLIKSLLKYWLRAAYRCTPFATFAGVSSPGLIGEKTQIIIGDVARYNRIDAEYIYLVTAQVEEKNAQMTYHPNTSLYAYDPHTLRYFERIVKVDPKQPDHYLYQYHFTKVDNNEYLEALLHKCRAGLTAAQMIRLLEQKDIDPNDARDYVGELIASQVVVRSDYMSTVGREYQQNFWHLATDPTLSTQLKQAKNLEDYQNLADSLSSIAQDKYPNMRKILASFFHVDSHRQTLQNQLKWSWITKIAQVIQVLAKTQAWVYPPTLQQFKTDFQKRYGEQFIPLNQALDPDNGILYPPHKKSLLKPFGLLNLPFAKGANPREIPLNRWNNFLLEKYIQVTTEGKQVIRFTGAEIQQKVDSTPAVQLPDTLSATVSLIQEEKLFISGIGFSATNLLGRFCHANTALDQKIQALTEYEQALQPEVILAEVVHNPAHPKTYNITNRPHHIRAHKVLLSSNATYFSEEETIQTQDLVIGIFNNQIVLYDTRHKKRVIPKLSNAHNYTNSNYPLYQLLGDLAFQQGGVINWDWGILGNQAFLPRVEIDGVVVAPARWIVQKPEDLNHSQIPQSVLLTLGDNQLLIDQEVPVAKEILLDTLSKQSLVVLEEPLFEDYIVKNTEKQGFTHQFIIPLKNTAITPLQSPGEIKNSQIHLLGGQWVYLKIYCGVLTADQLLRLELPSLVQQLKAAQLVQQWFFIRYQDEGGYHLRIRFRVNILQSEVFQRINQVLQNYLISHKIKLVYDAYIPEEQRYGGKETLSLCEQIFCYDSEAIIALLMMIHQQKNDETDMYMIPLAMQNIDFLLEDFGYTLPQKLAFISSLANSFRQEFRVNQRFKKALAKNYRTFQSLEPLDEKPYKEIYQKRAKLVAPIVQQIKQNIAEGTCKTSLAQLLSSISHMSLNRLFLEQARAQEMVTYDFLEVQYKAQIARKAATKS